VVRHRILNAWSYTLREGGKPQDLRGTDFAVFVNDVNEEDNLIGFTITNRFTDTPVVGPKNLEIGKELHFSYNGDRYVVLPLWALNTGTDANARRGRYADVFGLELRKVDNPESASQAQLAAH
jgi:hypothetical protein